MTEAADKQEKLLSVCLRRGIFSPASEIHKGLAGFYDYGSIGTKLKHNWEDYWRWFFLKKLGESFVEIEPSLIMPEPVFRASGHLEHFKDPVAQCSKCKHAERADQIVESCLHETYEGLTEKQLAELIEKHGIKCSKCGGALKEVGTFNLMFTVDVGPAKEKVCAFLRPETAQGAYTNFRREYAANRERLPLGLATVGRAFRNEISPRQALIRMREFSQAELQIFFDPDKIGEHARFDEVMDEKVSTVLVADRQAKQVSPRTCKQLAKDYPKFFIYYLARVQQFYDSLGVPRDRIRFYEKSEEERAFYNKLHFDIEILFDSFSEFKEVGGIHYRTDHDLGGHAKVSKRDMTVTKEGKKILPHVLELSFGVDRNLYALLDKSLREDDKRTFFAFPKQVAPFAAGVYPLVSKDGLDKKAEQVYSSLCLDFNLFYDDGGSIGRRYARADEIGVPLGITVDYDTLKEETVTVRDRDSTKQERVKISGLARYLSEFMHFQA